MKFMGVSFLCLMFLLIFTHGGLFFQMFLVLVSELMCSEVLSVDSWEAGENCYSLLLGTLRATIWHH